MKAAWLIVLVPLASIAPRARAETLPEPPMTTEAPFALTVNHVDKGDVIVVLRGEELFIDRADLRAAGIELETGQEEAVDGRRLLRLMSLSPPLRITVDYDAIAIAIEAPPELLPHTRIDLAERPPELVYQTRPSAFFNYAPRLDDRGRVALYEEMGLSIDGKLLFSSAYLSNSGPPVRGMTNLIVDDRPRLLRYTFGDALVRTGALGSGGFVGGVTLTRSYDLDPYALKTPRIGLVGSTPTPATIDVIVNGTRVRSEEIEPGTFEIDNLQVGGGSGLAGYVVRDVFGNEQFVATPFYMSSEALSPGIDEYTYSIGFLRGAVSRESWDYQEPVAFAHHRRGLPRGFTLGGRAEATTERVSAGPSLTMLTGFGQFDFDLGGSYDASPALGVAAQLAYSYSSRIFGCNLYGRLISNRYSTVGLEPEDDRPTAEFGAFLNVPLGGAMTFSYRSDVESTRDGGLAATFSAISAVRITNSLHWSTIGSRRVRERAEDEWEVSTTLSYVFTGGYSVQAAGRVSGDHNALRLQASKSLPASTGFGYRASATVAENVAGEGQLQYQTLFGRYGVRYAVDEYTSSVGVDAAGALVVVPGVGIFPTLPVYGAFGVIRVPDVAGVRGYGNHQEFGKTDRRGNLIVPNMLAYYGNHLSIAVEDVPLEYQLETTEMVLAPPPRGVALAEFRIKVPRFYRGRIVVLEGEKRIVPEYGQLRVSQRAAEAISPLGKAGEFELMDLESGARTAIVEWEGGSCEFQLEVAQPKQTVIELGELTCRRPPPAP